MEYDLSYFFALPDFIIDSGFDCSPTKPIWDLWSVEALSVDLNTDWILTKSRVFLVPNYDVNNFFHNMEGGNNLFWTVIIGEQLQDICHACIS